MRIQRGSLGSQSEADAHIQIFIAATTNTHLLPHHVPDPERVPRLHTLRSVLQQTNSSSGSVVWSTPSATWMSIGANGPYRLVMQVWMCMPTHDLTLPTDQAKHAHTILKRCLCPVW